MIVYKEGILFNGFPPPGRLILRELSERSTKSESNFGVKITSKRGTFGILEEFKLNNLTPTSSLLWMEAMRNEGGLENYSCESEIQNYVKRALTDCIDIGGFRPSFGVYLEVCCSPAAVMARGKRVCTNFFLKDTLAKTGVVEVKLPGFDFDHINQIVDSMIDLRNSANVRYVFGVLTTYKAWKILWFEDSNDAAVTTSKRAYEELCMAEVAHEYDISQKVTVYQSQLYEHSDFHWLNVWLVFFIRWANRQFIKRLSILIQVYDMLLQTRTQYFIVSCLKSSLNSVYLCLPNKLAISLCFQILTMEEMGVSFCVVLHLAIWESLSS